MVLQVLNWKDRRSLSESTKTTPETLKEAGRQLLAGDRLVEAADFMSRASDYEGLNLIKIQAISEGNYFVYRLVCNVLKKEPDLIELKDLAKAAASFGLTTYEYSAKNYSSKSK
jgi:hypothetical protein